MVISNELETTGWVYSNRNGNNIIRCRNNECVALMEITTNDSIWFTENNGHKFIYKKDSGEIYYDGKVISVWDDTGSFIDFENGTDYGYMTFEAFCKMWCELNN